MLNNKGIPVIILGVVLIISALLLFLKNRNEDIQAGEAAYNAVSKIEEMVGARSETAEGFGSSAPDTDSNTVGEIIQEHSKASQPITEDIDTSALSAEVRASVPVVMIDGYEYIGILEFPSLNLKLPVMSDWSYDKLTLAPCRQFGSAAGDDLVIAGHNYQSHFRPVRTLAPGDIVYFTDMDGNCIHYMVKENRTVAPEDVDSVQNSGYDLVLYTCTQGGAARVALFCDRMLS